ncbi:Ycf66 family protein [Limnoraphis robusta]|uniref:Ycf66 family protein n=1 Tax=Limnoraphis robusta CCNP1315 TaxID=3110306 RepID=A0ABU5TVR8_9CYAN|nr:Ycf66 family protein [Limnoraphis robusta]MEA5518994.1 Ycf66 family protein [Limnoraphis robusta CCNP1315]MEA5544034.1 Ycf66 family protein [Limnoraphis robusta CCNP1324]
MLADILAIAVGLGSFAVYMAAFFFPEVHRKNDFFWSGVGFFYALILWLCAGRITGAVLLGQIASVALLIWFGGQTLYLRRAVTPASQQTPVPPKLQEKVSSLFVVANDQPVTSAPMMPTLDQSPVALQTPPEPVETEPEKAPVPPEPPVVLEEVLPSVSPEKIEVETTPISETKIEEEKPATEEPEPAPLSVSEIEFEDEIIEEKIETTPQPQTPSQTPPKPQRLSRVFRAITGLFNRSKNPPSPAVSPVKTSEENKPQPLSETQTEEPTVEPEIRETVFVQENVTSEPKETPAAETEVLELTETDIDPDSVIETAFAVEVQEITITVEPETSQTSPFEMMKSASETSSISDEPQTLQPDDSSEEILSEPSLVVDENPTLKHPNPPDPELKEAAQKPDSDN